MRSKSFEFSSRNDSMSPMSSFLVFFWYPIEIPPGISSQVKLCHDHVSRGVAPADVCGMVRT